MGAVVVLGSLNADLTMTLPRLPNPGETLIGDRLVTSPGGKGANQAVAAARLGGQVKMVGRVGDDEHGRMLVDNLRASFVDVSGVEEDGSSPTGVALILVDGSGENVIAVAPGANGKVGQAEVERALMGAPADSLLVLQLEVPEKAVTQAVRMARQRGVRVILNAAPAARLPPELLAGLAVLVVNEGEAEVVLERPAVTPEEALEATRHAVAEAGVEMAIITLGGRGAVWATRDRAEQVEPFKIEPVDTVAAGDAFVGALAVCLGNGVKAGESVRLACSAGAAAASKPGAQASLPRPEDLKRLFQIDWGEEARVHSS